MLLMIEAKRKNKEYSLSAGGIPHSLVCGYSDDNERERGGENLGIDYQSILENNDPRFQSHRFHYFYNIFFL